MTSIAFSPHWAWALLFVAIPLIGLSLIPYFKTNKKYRRTRNRIVSLVLHCVIIVLVTCALAGMKFVHSVSNTANELLILVDVSDTQNEKAESRDSFINALLRESIYQNFTVGVVTFGLDQVYAVPLTTKVEEVYGQYLEAELPDTSATNIEAAIDYTRQLFNHPSSGKIVLVTDGKETDGSVISSAAVSAVLAQGSRLDTVYISSDIDDNEFQIMNVKTPDTQVKVGARCTLRLSIFSRDEGPVRINLYDNGEPVEIGEEGEKTLKYEERLNKGLQELLIPYTFKTPGMHELEFELLPLGEGGAEDRDERNNVYYTYTNLEVFKKVLIIENYSDQSTELKAVLTDPTLLGEDGLYEVSIYNLQEDVVRHYEGAAYVEEESPKSVDDLRWYDQVILNNISNKDLTAREIPLDELLYTYVYEFGGGMLTVGGNDEMGEAHAYNRSDMYGSVYQKMLPVEAVDYTPPVGVFIIVDVSGSMHTDLDGYPRLYWAMQGATACARALSERDQMGLLTLSSDYENMLGLTPATDQTTIRNAIAKLEDMPAGGTKFYPSLNYAVSQLRTANMQKNHIIFVSDGEVDPEDMAECARLAAQSYADVTFNLTISMVCIGGVAHESTKDLVLATRPAGWDKKIDTDEAGCGYYWLQTGQADTISTKLMQDLKSETVTAINYQTFNPIIYNNQSQVVKDVKRVKDNDALIDAKLNGYYGVKIKKLEGVELILTGSYQVPIYVRWTPQDGKGSVGSFMCDLKGGDWSGAFMRSLAGKQLIYNIIDDLMPKDDISPKEINYNLRSKNYHNHLTCPTTLEEGQKVLGKIITPSGESVSLNEVGKMEGCVVTRPLSEANKYSVCEFLVMEGGIYQIVLEKVDADGNVLASAKLYKEFSYSKEYDVEYELAEAEVRAVLDTIAKKGGGLAIDESEDVSRLFENYVITVNQIFDPRWLFLILAVVLFLLDVVVRKFKFKWPHEIIRDRKAQKAAKTTGEGRHEKNK